MARTIVEIGLTPATIAKFKDLINLIKIILKSKELVAK